MHRLKPISEHIRALKSNEKTSRALLETCLEAALDPSGEGPRVFTAIDIDAARSAADTADRQHKSGLPWGPLAGIPISVKDLFDIAGEVTTAGSKALVDAPPARRDATVIARLRSAGAILAGRNNMSEFAYSGLGLNPHYGTPGNPYDRSTGRVPGGSSSGSAVAVADGMSVASIGTDTGGSVRIPAALCGVTGYKPTANRVPLDGVLPLSPSLDSVGPIAPTVDCCIRLDSVLSGSAYQAPIPSSLDDLRIGVLQGYVLDDLDSTVSQRVEHAISLLSQAGANVMDVQFPSLSKIPEVNAKGGLIAYEVYAWHRALMESHRTEYDPRVLVRIMRGKEITSDEHLELMETRRTIISQADRVFTNFDIWILPTVPRIAPPIAEVAASDAAYFAANAAMLRNPGIVNFLDGCALTIPCHRPGEPPVGLTLFAPHGQDEKLLAVGLAVEAVLSKAGCAIAE